MNTNQESTNQPVRHDLVLVYASSIVIAILVTAASIAGLLFPDTVYPSDDLRQSFLPNDVSNLAIGLPMLLLSLWLSRRGKLIGQLLWPGVLFFILYNYLVYLLAMPLNGAFIMHLSLVALTLYTLFGLLAAMDGPVVQAQLHQRVPERLAGGILAGLGLLFFLQAAGSLASAITSSTPLADTEVALHITDFLISPAWVIGGLLLWRRKAFGYLSGLGLLFQASMLFVGLILVLLIQPLISSESFALVDVLVVLVLGLICFIPLWLFARGVASNPNQLPS